MFGAEANYVVRKRSESAGDRVTHTCYGLRSVEGGSWWEIQSVLLIVQIKSPHNHKTKRNRRNVSADPATSCADSLQMFEKPNIS